MTVRDHPAPVRSAPLGFVTPLAVELVSESPRRWRLTAPLVYRSAFYRLPDHSTLASRAREMAADTIVVPPGFETDFASVPRIPVAWLVAGDTAVAPATLHDWAYTLQFCSRDEADELFREAMEVQGVGWFKRRAMYRAVRWFGASAWDGKTMAERLRAVELMRAWIADVSRGPAAA